MYSFTNDYSEGAHPRILEAIINSNLIQHAGYGMDQHVLHASELIKQEICKDDADVHFITGGTQTNLITISTALRPHQAVITADTGHINIHETGAIEATGHKVLAIPCTDGKLTPSDIRKSLDFHTDEHMVQPKLVYISNSTEVGTQYTKSELEAIHHTCHQNGLYLFLDGARMGAALTSPINDLTLEDIAALVDVFYIGGTKNGALFGEALIILHPELKPDFRYMIKQRGAMMAKGWLLGIQFEELFRNHLFYDLAAHSNTMASKLRHGISSCGFEYASNSMTNQLFPIFPNALIEQLSTQFSFNTDRPVNSQQTIIRLVTSWCTKEESVDHFINTLKSIS